MAIQDFFNDDWDNYTHDDVEESLKEQLSAMQTSTVTLQNVVTALQAQVITQETDPTVPSWAKQPTPPESNNITYSEDTTTLNII